MVERSLGLKPYLREGLDVLFVALNPPRQSHANGHWFSGSSSRFFKLLAVSGLTSHEPSRDNADEIVFGSTNVNYLNMSYGVTDLVPRLAETNSHRVRASKSDAAVLVHAIRHYAPRTVCIIHSKVRRILNSSGYLSHHLEYGANGKALEGSEAMFFLNYFPNGNNVPDSTKVRIFKRVKRCLSHASVA